jgi:hypothetical protein
LEEKLKPTNSNSYVRFKEVENRLSATSKINDVLKKKHYALRIRKITLFSGQIMKTERGLHLRPLL